MESIRPNDTKRPEDLPELFGEFPQSSDSFKTTPPAYWSPYKSPGEKLRYESDLPKIIQPFVRSYFQQHESEMQELQEESTVDYTAHLKEAWAKHLIANKAADTFLSYEQSTPLGNKDWSPREWIAAKHLLKATMETDHVKAMYSGGVKMKLDVEARKLKERYGSQYPDFEKLLLTPSFPTFYEERELYQQKFRLSELDGMPDEGMRALIIEKYHGGDSGVFEKRKLAMDGATADQLRERIATTEASFAERAAKKGYFIAERPDLQAFEELLRFDNTTEYEYTYSLKGLPDLFLREAILKRLKETGTAPDDKNVFELTFPEYERMIDMVLEDVSNDYTIELNRYRQHYDTCGAVCVMSILNTKGVRMDEDNELRIWEMVGKPYNFPGGLGWVLQRNGFQVTYVQDSGKLLDPKNPEFATMSSPLVAATKTYIDLHEKALAAGMAFEIADWGYSRVKEEIERGNICILYIHVTDTITHVVLANGWKDDHIKIIDPLASTRDMKEYQLNTEIVHPMGKRLLIVKKLPNDLFDVLDDELSKIDY